MAAESQPVTSFVLRFSPSAGEGAGAGATGERRYRIRITHVQDQKETVVCSMQEAFDYIEEALKKGQVNVRHEHDT